MANIKYKQNGEYKDIVVKVGDTTPIGGIIGYDTTQPIPNGWEYYAENQIKKIAPVTPANGNIENSYGTSQTNTYAQEYQNEHNVIVSSTTPTTSERVWFKQSKNIFGAIPPTETKNGITLTNNGDGTFNLVGTATAQTEFIWWKDFSDYKNSMKQNAKWSSYVNKSNSGVIYQLSTWNGTTASPVWASTPIQFTQTQTDKSINTSTFGSLLRFNIQINNGTSVNLTNIEVALEMTSEEISYNKYLGYSSININGNDEYYKNIYSTEEQVIGTWLGKSLYRKTINFGALPNNSSKQVAIDVTNFDKLVNLYGVAYSTGYTMLIPFIHNDTTNIVNVYFNNGTKEIGVATHSDRSAYTESYITIEYTKTTD